jgi:hypothetical protein
MHRAKNFGNRASPARTANVLLALSDFLKVCGLSALSVKQVYLECQPASPWDGFQHALQWRVGDESAVPVEFAVDLDRRKALPNRADIEM